MDEISKYCKPNRLSAVGLAAFGVVYIIGTIFIIILCLENAVSININHTVLKVLTIISSLLFFRHCYKDMVVKYENIFDKRWSYLQQNGMLNSVMFDFKNGNQIFSGNLLIGRSCLIGKNCGLIVFYNEINCVHYYPPRIVSDESSSDGYILIESGGTKYKLCSVPKKVNSNDVENFRNFVLSNGLSFEDHSYRFKKR